MPYKYNYKPKTINPNVHVGDLVRVKDNYFLKGYRGQIGEVVEVMSWPATYIKLKFSGVPTRYRAHSKWVDMYGSRYALEIPKGSVEVLLSI